MKAEALASIARRTWGDVKGGVERAFKTIQAKLDEALGTAKKEAHPAATTTKNTSAVSQREVTRRTKGVVCEGKAAAYMIMMGYDLISVDWDVPHGLDGVFEHDGKNPGRNVTAPVVFDPKSSKPPPYPKFVVLEAKYDGTTSSSDKSQRGKLWTTKTGRQGSRPYTQEARLSQAVADTKAGEIRASNRNKGPESWLFVCLAGVSVLFIDVKRKWPDLYTGNQQSGRGQTRSRRVR